MIPSAQSMSDLALRDHSREILLAIARDMETSQSKQERSDKSKRMELMTGASDSAASGHGALRQLAGFDLMQLVGEFRAMRASVLALWRRSAPDIDAASAIEEIARFNEGIDQALAESVERYSTDVATFLAVVGHDLRSPLWSIQGMSELLASRDLPPETRQEAVQRINRSSKLMANLIADLLQFTGAQLGRGIPIRYARCDLRVVCNHALDAVRATYPRHEFTEIMAGDLVVQADGMRMQQVLSNLLANAVHHGEPGSPITLRATGQEDAVLLEVTNAGKPIPTAALQAIFEPLMQAPSRSEPHQQPYTGLGLGLFIVREIVNRHQGTITVASTAADGTVFTVRLPRNAAEARADC